MKKGTLSTIICGIIVLISFIAILAFAAPKAPSRDSDDEFLEGSGIEISQLTDLQAESLYKLCKVWGYAKYRHPSVIDGTLNWDAELFRVMPDVLDAASPDEANTVLFLWLSQFPFEAAEPGVDTQQWIDLQDEKGMLSADTDWISDTSFLGSDLSGYLERLSRVFITDRKDSYASFDLSSAGQISCKNEKMLPYSPQDDGVKLLALFRFWNIYEYYSPYVSITKIDWDEALKQAIPRMPEADTYRDYVLAIAETAALTGDAHIAVNDRQDTVESYYGTYFLPCLFQTVEGQVVVSEAAGSEDDGSLERGDIITAVNGISIDERVETLSRYTAVPEEGKFSCVLNSLLLRSERETADVDVVRNGEAVSLSVTCSESSFVSADDHSSRLIADGRIGYLNPVVSSENELEQIMEDFQDTEGIIVDLRYYPPYFVYRLLGEYLIPEPTQFAVAATPNAAEPGSFYRNDYCISGSGYLRSAGISDKEYPLYQGRVVILMDETSMSRTEYTIMALRQCPNAVVVGTPSLGADGDIVSVSLPGQITFSISGLGIFTPDGGQTQRIGLQPDIECAPTVEGIREGRDELIEKATEIILSEKEAE